MLQGIHTSSCQRAPEALRVVQQHMRIPPTKPSQHLQKVLILPLRPNIRHVGPLVRGLRHVRHKLRSATEAQDTLAHPPSWCRSHTRAKSTSTRRSKPGRTLPVIACTTDSPSGRRPARGRLDMPTTRRAVCTKADTTCPRLHGDERSATSPLLLIHRTHAYRRSQHASNPHAVGGRH